MKDKDTKKKKQDEYNRVNDYSYCDVVICDCPCDCGC